MQLRASVVGAILMPFLSGCLAAPPGHMANSVSTTQQHQKFSPSSPIQKCDTPSPGPTGNVTIDGAELRLARYPQGQFGGTLQRSIIGADPHTFNYWQAGDTTSRELAGLMWGGLIDTDYYTGKTVPALATAVEILPDHVTYITHLRKGLKWSDGTKLTSADVAYTWNVIVKGGYGDGSMRDIATVDGKFPTVTTIDELTNKFVTARPFIPFYKVLGLAIAPKHIVEKTINGKNGRESFSQLWSTEARPEDFVTSGPFTLASYLSGQRISFKRTKNYFGVDHNSHRLPYLNEINYAIIGDATTNQLKFRAKEIDITEIRPRDAGDLVPLAKDGNYKLYDFGPGQGSTFISFNLNRRKDPSSGKAYVNPVQSNWFHDINFRQAINHAIDRRAIVKNYLRGLGVEAFTAQVSTSTFYDSNLKPFAADLELSKNLLKKSGFTSDKDGNLIDSTGHKVEFDLLTGSGSAYWTFIGTSFKEDLRKLGIKVNYTEVNFNTLSDKISHSLDWQAVLFGLSGGDPLEPNDGANVLLSSGRLHLFDQRLPDSKGIVKVSDARPWEKEIDDLMEKGPLVFDTKERKAIYNKVDQIIYDQCPFIYTASGTMIAGVRNTLQNYAPTPLSQANLGLHNLEEIWLK